VPPPALEKTTSLIAVDGNLSWAVAKPASKKTKTTASTTETPFDFE